MAAAAPVQAAEATARPVTIFAAASTANAVNAVAAAYQAGSGVQVRPVFAASSTLARQIAQGAPADLFLSASADWMDFVAARGFLAPGSRVELLANRLVLIAPARRGLEVAIEPGFAVGPVLGGGRLALGDPGHVPAGIYAKAALERLGVWADVRDRLAYAPDVRAALALVERGEAPAGMVYASDAAISSRVAVAGVVPAEAHPPIRYPLARMLGAGDGAGDEPGHEAVKAFHAFLQGAEARAIFRAHGFSVPGFDVPGAEG